MSNILGYDLALASIWANCNPLYVAYYLRRRNCKLWKGCSGRSKGAHRVGIFWHVHWWKDLVVIPSRSSITDGFFQEQIIKELVTLLYCGVMKDNFKVKINKWISLRRNHIGAYFGTKTSWTYRSQQTAPSFLPPHAGSAKYNCKHHQRDLSPQHQIGDKEGRSNPTKIDPQSVKKQLSQSVYSCNMVAT